MSKLILIPTPIGNLGDITQRAVECIKTVDILLCEDTREEFKIVKSFKIKKPQNLTISLTNTQLLKKLLMRFNQV